MVQHAGDGWVECGCGAQHWGRFGAAGLLLTDGVGPAPAVVLQHRALWSHHGGTWGIPGGALGPGEPAADGAVREAVEEAGVPDDAVRVWSASVLAHPDWAYTTVVGEAIAPFTPVPTDAESLEVTWVPVPAVTGRDLLPAFGEAWPRLVPLLGRRVLVVVDAANVVGSRPDGWWRDRPGAAARLHAALAAALPRGFAASVLSLPADRWWPDVLVVLEGAARGADADSPARPEAGARPALGVVRATTSGDDAIHQSATEALRDGRYTDVVVVTADRALAERVRAAGASTVGPRALLAAVEGVPPSTVRATGDRKPRAVP